MKAMIRSLLLACCCITITMNSSCAKSPTSTEEPITRESISIEHAGQWRDLSKAEMNAAFSGDPGVAMSIAEEFADAESREPAIYWYQIASENGNPQAMQALAILLRKSNCKRAIFWLESYIAHGAGVIGAEPYIQAQASLKNYRAECGH
ncbi:MAG: hypothetical protein L0H63_12175 [Nitrococcus sp.]|nr:hypothetical protein [Nitrococcus sp.]